MCVYSKQKVPIYIFLYDLDDRSVCPVLKEIISTKNKNGENSESSDYMNSKVCILIMHVSNR